MKFEIISFKVSTEEKKKKLLPPIIKIVCEILEGFNHIHYEWEAQYHLDKRTFRLLVFEKGSWGEENYRARLYTLLLFDSLKADLEEFVESILWDHIYQLSHERLIKKEKNEHKEKK